MAQEAMTKRPYVSKLWSSLESSKQRLKSIFSMKSSTIMKAPSPSNDPRGGGVTITSYT